MGEYKWLNRGTDHTLHRIYCLGSFKVFLPGAAEPLGEGSSHKSWALLKYMAAHQGSPIPTERILDAFWPNRKNPNDTAALRTALCRLKMMLRVNPVKNSRVSLIKFSKDTCRLNIHTPVWIDCAEFEKQCALARQIGSKDRQSGIDLYLDALDLYQGDFLAEDLYLEWTTIPREHYRRLFIQSIMEAAEWLIDLNRYREARSIIEKALQMDPLIEELHYLLLHVLVQQDELKSAFKHYLYCTNLLSNELGVKPSEKLKAIYQIIRGKMAPTIDYFDLKDELGKQLQYSGPMICDPDIFWNFLLFTRRQITRNKSEASLVILEFKATEDQIKKPMLKIGEILGKITRQSLRKSDLMCRLSERQMALLLPGTGQQGSEAAIGHIKKAFFEIVPSAQVTLQSNIKLICPFQHE